MTPEELAKIVSLEEAAAEQYRETISVCVAAGCMSMRSDQIKESLEKEVSRAGMERHCQVKGVGCMGLCAAGPLVSVEPKGVMYQTVTPADTPEILQSLDKEPVE